MSRNLRPLVERLYDAICAHAPDIARDLENLLEFLASETGRTDANCCVVDRFFAATEETWRELPPPLRDIFSDMSATLHDAIYAPAIASTFGSLPEQLLARVRGLELNQ
ncbi:MAG TPA: hypothetical protein VJ853_05955 [Thermoanaerobaculia bacterium]|nr:hypothetical protein [Thermoanaerobaculia bacterium]